MNPAIRLMTNAKASGRPNFRNRPPIVIKLTDIGMKNNARCFTKKLDVRSTHSNLIIFICNNKNNRIIPITFPGMGR